MCAYACRRRKAFIGTFVSFPLEENPDILLLILEKMTKKNRGINISQSEPLANEM